MSNKLIGQILRESEIRIKDYQLEMDEFERDPMILIKKTFRADGLFLLNMIYQYGEEALLEMQQYWYRRLIPHLREYLGVEEVHLSFDETVFPAPIQFYMGEEEIAALQIYDRIFYRYESPYTIELADRIRELEKQKELLSEEMEKQEIALKNPFVLGGANVVKLADIAIRQQKYKNETKEEVHQLQSDLLDVERELTELRLQLENNNGPDLVREHILDKIEQRIRLLPGYESLAPIDEEGDLTNDNEEERLTS